MFKTEKKHILDEIAPLKITKSCNTKLVRTQSDRMRNCETNIRCSLQGEMSL